MIRSATPEESSQAYPGTPGYETVVFVVDNGRGMEGHTCLSRDDRGLGMPVGHNTRVWSKDPHDLIRLWRRARQQLADWGWAELFIHEEPDTPLEIREFWEGRGFTHELTVLKGRVLE